MTLGGGTQQEGYAKFTYARGGVYEPHKMTVFAFDPATMGVTAGGTYSIQGNGYTTTGGNAVDYSASATLTPVGTDCTDTEVKELRVGMIQNLLRSTRVTRWINPTITWNPGVPAGTRTQPVPLVIARALRLRTTRAPAPCAWWAPASASPWLPRHRA